MSCYGFTDNQPCKFTVLKDEDFCPLHDAMFSISTILKQPHAFLSEPKVFKTEYRYKLKYVTNYRYMSQMYEMEKYIEKKLARFKHFFEATLIQRCFRRAISNPQYELCRNRLLKEYMSLHNNAHY